MSKPLVIFGAGDVAELALYYFESDTDYKVAAFSLDSEFIDKNEYCGRPMVPFEDLKDRYPPTEFELFVALGYTKVNKLRRQKYEECKDKGYRLASYISPRARTFNASIGDNCFIFEDNVIQPFVKVGNNVTLWSGNHVGHHTSIADHVFIASHAVISGRVTIGEQVFVGVNATLRDHIVVGDRSVIGAGALLLSDAPEESVYIGSKTEPAKLRSSKLRGI